MKKLKLMLDELRVETFETVKATERLGTVMGRADSSAGPIQCQNQCPSPSDWCFPSDVCVTGSTCGPTADHSCVCMSNEWECPQTDDCPSWEISACPENGNC